MAQPTKIDDQIISAMITQFKAIVSGTEYYNTYDPNVFDNHEADYSTYTVGEKPGINIREVKEELTNELEANSSLHECSLNLEIDLVTDDPQTTNIREIKADILKSIADDLTWGGLAHTTKYVSATRNPEDDQGNKISDATIRIKVIYRKNAWSKN